MQDELDVDLHGVSVDTLRSRAVSYALYYTAAAAAATAAAQRAQQPACPVQQEEQLKMRRD
jgi:hypothetical protein